MLESLLDEIPGLGATRRKALLEKFGSVAGIRKADASEISQIPGIGEKIASQIAHHLSQVGTSSVDMETGEISSN
jgi:excinuclease ABC subunit C